jgi:outer membrane protein OmpA-like peptidoglycan-associated protein
MTMKTLYKIPLLFALVFFGWTHSDAQILKKLKKRAAEAAEETILRKVEEKTADETEKTMDSILEAPGKKMRKKRGNTGADGPYDEESEKLEEGGYDGETDLASLEIYSKFDFVPGDQPLFFDDFEADYIGDFPSKWNTNGGGEVVSTSEGAEKWYEMKAGYTIYHVPDLPQLPEEYTIEFDLLATGLDQRTASTSVLKIILSDDPGFKLGNYAYAQMSFCQYSPVGLWVRNSTKDINNEVSADIREALLNQPHISIAVNKQRFRLWVNENKVVDIPRLVPATNRPDRLKFELINFKDGKERLFIRNLKVAEGGQDLRRQLIEEGAVSTTGILFESGSANLQPQSLGIIRQVSQVLQQDNSLSLQIIGHTDSDGDEVVNKALSQRRAEAVIGALVSVYGIDPGRLVAEGKGESEPVADNSTSDGKAKNRRVQFVKL